MGVRVSRAGKATEAMLLRSRRHRHAVALLYEHDWRDGRYSIEARVFFKGDWPKEREVVLYDDGTAWLYESGKEMAPESIHNETGWRRFREFVTEERVH